MTAATTGVLIIEELKDFLETVGQARTTVGELNPKNANLVFYSAHLKTIITFAAQLASTLEYVEKDHARSSEYYEKFAEIHEELDYVDITDLEYLTSLIKNKFLLIHQAYAYEVPRPTKVFFDVIIANIKDLEYYLCQK